MMSELLVLLLPAVTLLGLAALVLAAWLPAAAPAVAVPRSRSVGGRARDHGILLVQLPPASHPDAAGHVRSRAPGLLPPVA